LTQGHFLETSVSTPRRRLSTLSEQMFLIEIDSEEPFHSNGTQLKRKLKDREVGKELVRGPYYSNKTTSCSERGVCMARRGVITIVASLLLIVGCTQGQHAGSPKTFVVKMPGDHLDLGALYQAFRNFPDQTIARQFTQTETISNPSLRESLLIRLYKGGFTFEDVLAKNSDLLKDYVAAQQAGCEAGAQVTMITQEGETDSYVVKSCGKDHVTIQSSDSENIMYTYELTDSTSLRLTKRFEAIDTCVNATEENPNSNESRMVRQNSILETVRIIRWGEPNVVKASAENVSAEMLKLIAKGAAQVPDSLANISESGMISVSANDLATLNQSRLKPAVDLCPNIHPRPPQHPGAPSDPEAGPEPEPDYPTAPGGSPEPVPEPTPVPSPTPAPGR
jgi:hypothetical protein